MKFTWLNITQVYFFIIYYDSLFYLNWYDLTNIIWKKDLKVSSHHDSITIPKQINIHITLMKGEKRCSCVWCNIYGFMRVLDLFLDLFFFCVMRKFMLAETYFEWRQCTFDPSTKNNNKNIYIIFLQRRKHITYTKKTCNFLNH